MRQKQIFVCGHQSGYLSLYKTEQDSSEVPCRIKKHNDSINSIKEISYEDKNVFITCGNDKKIVLWEYICDEEKDEKKR